MNNYNSYAKLRALIAAVIISTAALTTTAISTSFQRVEAAKCILGCDVWVISNDALKTPQRAPIATSGDKNVYVTWWERANLTSNEPVMRISNDNGKTFGEKVMLSAK